MDIRMPDMDGLEATARIVDEADSSVRVIVLTTFDADEYVYEALRAGASGFVLKDTPRHELVAAVRTVFDGGAMLSPDHHEPPHRTVCATPGGRHRHITSPRAVERSGARRTRGDRPWAQQQ